MLVKHPKILLLDEATSSLDSASEAAVQDAIDNVLKSKRVTTFVVAHRLSTIRQADLIVVMDAGKIVETGTHDNLLQKKSAYYSLVQAQKTRQNVETEALQEKAKYTTQASDFVSVSPFDETIDSELGRTVAIHFSGVSFRYPTRPETDVLRNLNLTIYEGETLAIVGESGCGKSTVIGLVELFYYPSSGVVEYFGMDLKEVNVQWLRDQLGLVSQEAALFEGTIADNIRFGCPDATHAQVLEAAKQAYCHEFIADFPDGYNTLMKDGGSGLVSGGQRQRIAIARALIKQPKVLLLDEASASLDSESEQIVQSALEKLMARQGQTCIMIAHRLATVKNADRIAVIANGAVAEIGTHDELMKIPDGRYRKIQAMQDLTAGAAVDRHSNERMTMVAPQTQSPLDSPEKRDEDIAALSDHVVAENSRRAWLMGASDWPYLAIGTCGALLAGLNFPAVGWVWAYMIELLYQPVQTCEVAAQFLGFANCNEYHDDVASDMRRMSFLLTYGFIGLIAVSLGGLSVAYWGFGSGAERMNKRVRDAAFTSIVRQEVAWHDINPPGELSSRLAEDTAMLQAFAGMHYR